MTPLERCGFSKLIPALEFLRQGAVSPAEGDILESAIAELEKTKFGWLIEAPGAQYLAVQKLHMSNNFEWTTDHNRALAFRSQEQADALMMAVRQMDRQTNGFDKGLFGFEASLGNAKATEHGWITAIPEREPRTAAGSLD